MNTLLDEVTRVHRDGELLYPAYEIQAALQRLAVDISNALFKSNPVVLSIMTGGLVFSGMLLPLLDFPLQIDYVHATRFRGDTCGHNLEWRMRAVTPLRGRTVLLMDDVCDKGLTLAHIVRDCRKQGAQHVFTAVLIHKQCNDSCFKPDFSGLFAPDRYLFGCGMDYKNYLRNLPAVYALRNGVIPNQHG